MDPERKKENIEMLTAGLRELSEGDVERVSSLYEQVAHALVQDSVGRETLIRLLVLDDVDAESILNQHVTSKTTSDGKGDEETKEDENHAGEEAAPASLEQQNPSPKSAGHTLSASASAPASASEPLRKIPSTSSAQSPSSLRKTAPAPKRPHNRQPPGLAKLALTTDEGPKTARTGTKRKAGDAKPKRHRAKKPKVERPDEEVVDEIPRVPKEVGAFLTPLERPYVGSWKCSLCNAWNSRYWATCRGFLDDAAGDSKKRRCTGNKTENSSEVQEKKEGIEEEKEEEHKPGDWLCRYCGTWNHKFDSMCEGEGPDLPWGSCTVPKEDASEYEVFRTPMQKFCDKNGMPYPKNENEGFE